MTRATQTTAPLLVSVADAAALLSVSHITIRRMLKAGVLPKVQVANAVRIPHAAVVAVATPSVGQIGEIAPSANEDNAATS